MRGHTHTFVSLQHPGWCQNHPGRCGLGEEAEQTVPSAVFRNTAHGGAGGDNNFEVMVGVEIQPLCPARHPLKLFFLLTVPVWRAEPAAPKLGWTQEFGSDSLW